VPAAILPSACVQVPDEGAQASRESVGVSDSLGKLLIGDVALYVRSPKSRDHFAERALRVEQVLDEHRIRSLLESFRDV
jgi:hypothetical protein